MVPFPIEPMRFEFDDSFISSCSLLSKFPICSVSEESILRRSSRAKSCYRGMGVTRRSSMDEVRGEVVF